MAAFILAHVIVADWVDRTNTISSRSLRPEESCLIESANRADSRKRTLHKQFDRL